MSSSLTSPSPKWDQIVRQRMTYTFSPQEISEGVTIVEIDWPAPMSDNNYSVVVVVENPQQALGGHEVDVLVSTFKKKNDGSGVYAGVAVTVDPGGPVIFHATAFHD